MSRRSNHALVSFQAELGPEDASLGLEWADHVGDATPDRAFEVHTDDARDAFVGIQAYGVGDYGHEVIVNDTPLTGFDLPPHDNWQYWLDSVTGTALRDGTNRIRIERDVESDDCFAVGTVLVQWTEPIR